MRAWGTRFLSYLVPQRRIREHASTRYHGSRDGEKNGAQMNGEHGSAWYGPSVRSITQHAGYRLVTYDCTGTGSCMDYALFSGIDLIFMDFDSPDAFRESTPAGDILDLRHYRQGRVEFEFADQRAAHLQEGEFCINALPHLPTGCSFPLGACSGVSLVVDHAALDAPARAQLELYGIDVYHFGSALDLEGHWYLSRTPASLARLFDELYAARGVEAPGLFRLKALELLYRAQSLRGEDRRAATYYSRAHIDIVKRAWGRAAADLEARVTVSSLIADEDISMVTFQAIFKQVYGDTFYAHLKKFKMARATEHLRSGASIGEVAASLGYSNASKFAQAFRDVFGLLPKDYRAQHKRV